MLPPPNLDGPDPDAFTRISEHDQMLHGDNESGRNHYFSVSQSGLDAIAHALRMAAKTEVRRILDFPSGHGRVLRSLVREFPQAEIIASDLDHDGVDFCVSNFGVVGVYSQVDVSQVRFENQFDLIWCGSLLTHLREAHTLQVFNFLVDQLDDNGVLVCTLHGRYAAGLAEPKPRYAAVPGELERDNYAYVGTSYVVDGDYEIPDYGGAYVTLSWIASLIQPRDDLRIVYFSERRWDDHQDVLAVQKRPIREGLPPRPPKQDVSRVDKPRRFRRLRHAVGATLRAVGLRRGTNGVVAHTHGR